MGGSFNLTLETEINTEDLKDFAEFKRRTGLKIDHDEDFEIECTGCIHPYVKATHWDPAEGGDVEDFGAFVGKVDITDLLTSSITEDLEEKLAKTIPCKEDLY